MKKILLGMSVIASTFAFSQSKNSSLPFQLGIKAGINASSISSDGYDDTNTKAGFVGGFFANFPIAEKFNIQPEVLYSQLGSEVSKKYSVAGVTSSVDGKLNLDYITIPVMFQYKATPALYLEAGPEFGFLVNAKQKGTVIVNGSTVSTDSYDVKDNYNGFNFGLGLGAGYDITPNFGVNIRYIAGFTDINKDGETSVSNSDNTNRNNAFQGGVYFKF